jgi:hypothetical protein
VILVLHDEEKDLTVWVDARSALRRGENPIHLDEGQILDKESLLMALSFEGPLPATRTEPSAILREMARARFVDSGVDVSFLDLFSFGLIDLSMSIYFGMETFMEAAEMKAAAAGDESGMGIGFSTYQYIDQYVGFLVARDIARIDFDSWRQMAEENEMTGRLLGPLTSVGRGLVAALRDANADLADGLRGPVIETRTIQFLPLRIFERAIALRAIGEALAKP